jgi:hypothetical protein
VGQDEAICFQITEQSKNACVPYMALFIMNNTIEDEYVFSFKINQLALTHDELQIPQTNFQSIISIPSTGFQRILRCSDKRGDYVQICTRNQSKDDNYIIFSTEATCFHMKYQVDPKLWKDSSCLKLERYSLKYLLLITKATSLSNFVTIYLQHDFVLAVRYNIGTIGSIMFCLAPHVDPSDTIPSAIVSIKSIFGDDELSEDEIEYERKLLENQKPEEKKITKAKKRKVDTIVVNGTVLKDEGQKLKRKRRKRKKKNDELKTCTLITDFQKKNEHKPIVYSGNNLPSGKHMVNEVLINENSISPGNLPSTKLCMPELAKI